MIPGGMEAPLFRSRPMCLLSGEETFQARMSKAATEGKEGSVCDGFRQVSEGLGYGSLSLSPGEPMLTTAVGENLLDLWCTLAQMFQ